MIKIRFIVLFLLILTSLNSCGMYERSDVKDNPVNIDERVQKNIQEGRGIRFGKGATRGGDFDFASSNPLWRASIEIFEPSGEGYLDAEESALLTIKLINNGMGSSGKIILNLKQISGPSLFYDVSKEIKSKSQWLI